MATYNLTQTTPSNIKTGDILNCPYSGAIRSVELPAGQYKLQVWGASGGHSYGGKGGYSEGVLTIQKNTTLYICVGGAGKAGSDRYAAGGWNGGGSTNNNNSSTGNYGGGGATDIRTIQGTVTVLSSSSNVYVSYVGGTQSLNSRIIVAGGGGGYAPSFSFDSAGAGGGTSGTGPCPGTQSGITERSATCCGDYKVGHQYAGFGYGGYTNNGSTTYGHICGGGGGWYGGNFGSNSAPSGGSGYVSSALTNIQTINGESSFPSTSGSTETGHSGNGYARITVISVDTGLPFKIKQNGEWKDISKGYTRISGQWKEIDKVFRKVSGEWIEN